MFKIEKQLSKLYLLTIWSSLSLAGAWVAILASRGFSLVEIGIGEMVFHITSLLFEIPSGALADVLGRKKMLLVSAIMRMLGNFVMIISWNFPMVCISLALNALSYNATSGSDDALAYDSLKLVKRENHYEKYGSNQMILYRLCDGISTLCAGFALVVGYKIAYATGIFMGIFQIVTALSLKGVQVGSDRQYGSVMQKIIKCFKESFHFLYREKKIMFLMLCNCFVGAVDVLLLFFLQAKLPQCGMPEWGLGIALLLMQMGGIVGSRMVLKMKHWRYFKVVLLTFSFVIIGFLVEHSGLYIIMTLGGFLSAIGDDALQVRTNAKIQGLVPSEQRATITSVESFLFSIIMIVFSPLAGMIFSIW